MDHYLPSSLPPISVVEVVVLKNVDVDDIRGAVAASSVSVSLHDEDAQRVAALWRQLPTGEPHRCHLPPFGLRFLDGEVVVCQASLCWKCNNIFGEVSGEAFSYDFDSSDSISQDLLNECRSATGESDVSPNPYFERLEELRQIMQSPYGMEKLMAIWRQHNRVPDGQLPEWGVDLVSEILRQEFPGKF